MKTPFSILTEEKCVTPDQPTNNVIILIGAPGSGKSAVSRLGLLNVDNVSHVTPDKWIEMMARRRKISLSDPIKTAGLHAQISPLHRKHKEASMSPNARSNFVLESTGRRLAGLQYTIGLSHNAGLRVVVVYVSVSLETAHHGNDSRERRVPHEVITVSHGAAESNFNAVVPLADEAWRIDNDTRPTFAQMRTSAFIKRIK